MKILLESPIFTQSGYGEHSRLVYRALKLQDGVDIYVNPLNWGTTSWASSLSSSEKEEIVENIKKLGQYTQSCKEQNTNLSFDVQIHVGIPSEFEKKAPYSICVTAGIETDRVSAEWLFRTHKGIDKLIVPSQHAKNGFEKTSYEVQNNVTQQKTILECASKVEVVPYPVKEIETVPLDFKTTTDFNFLAVALLGPRKNIENTIKWFCEEFKDENVGLIIKTGFSKGGPIDKEKTVEHLMKTVPNSSERKCKVYLLHGDLEEAEIHSLYNREDVGAFITATHGEGYGLPVFEAAYHGLPIVATDWSAHVEFLSAEYKEGGKIKNKKLFAKVDYDLKPIPREVVWKDILIEGSQWSYPKEKLFKKQLRNVYRDNGMYKKWAKVLQESIKENYKQDKVLDHMNKTIFEHIGNISSSEDIDVVVL